MEGKITISKEEYKHLLETCYKYGLLLDSIYDTKELNWNNEFLKINSEEIGRLLTLIDKYRYGTKVKELKEKENNE